MSLVNNGHSLQVNGKLSTLSLPDGTYTAAQLRFHFPSEHELDGTLFGGEMQIVHQKDGSNGTDDLAIVSTFLQVGHGTNESFKFFLSLGFGKDFPEAGQSLTLPGNTRIDLAESLKEQLAGRYFHYRGSLTTPPCSETVHWYVLQTPMPVSKKIVKKFKEQFPLNNRPVQDLNGRAVVLDRLAVTDEFSKEIR